MEQALALDLVIERAAQSRLPQVDLNNPAFGRTFTDHMLSADYIGGKWTNVRIVPFQNLSLNPATSALHYGQAIFEGLKAYKSPAGEVLCFRPDENFKRMNRSALRMCMPEIPEEIFLGGLRELLNLDRDWVPQREGCSLYIRPVMFATDAFIGLRPSETYKFLIFCSPAGVYYSAPVKVKVETHYTRAAQGGTGAAKAAGNYAAAMYPTKLAYQEGYDQILWTDGKEHKYIEEAGTMNIMFIINDTLITAPETDTILPGITRKSVLQLAREWGVPVEERKPSVEEVIAAIQNGTLQEAFGVGTAATIAHIKVIGYEGVQYELPDVQNRPFSNKVFQELEDIKRGRKPDTRGWIMKV
ncbi:MAG: branched-chain amino acid aminotransferase [Cytophagales bacterium]|nr:branched-chain amino acid aminotransferase [Bernardetiaceae bacterium]MDW8210972.1 branched-chain amino acid aminotransferase [Cytophagales bacterium]